MAKPLLLRLCEDTAAPLFLVALLAGGTATLTILCKELRDALKDDVAGRRFEVYRWPALAALTGGDSTRGATLRYWWDSMVNLAHLGDVRLPPNIEPSARNLPLAPMSIPLTPHNARFAPASTATNAS